MKELVNNLLHCFFQELQYFSIRPRVHLLFIIDKWITILSTVPVIHINLNDKLLLLELLPLSQWFTIAEITAEAVSPFVHISVYSTDHDCQKCAEFNVEVSGLKANQTTWRLKCINVLQHFVSVLPVQHILLLLFPLVLFLFTTAYSRWSESGTVISFFLLKWAYDRLKML